MHCVNFDKPVKLSIVIPAYNEEATIEKCINKVLNISDDQLSLEIIIVDDCSTDCTRKITFELVNKHPDILLLHHEKNKGKGAALRTGFQKATGDFVAIQDADLEYDPEDLKKLLIPLVSNDADVVLGSRFLSSGFHRVLYFWHYLGNRFLTFLSNMFTDLNLTDIETCYKVFRRDIIQNIEIKEDRFGFEPEIVAKIAHIRLRIYEMGISYKGRTYEEGKKIGVKDGLRALYCIFHYNAHRAPIPLQFLLYLLIGSIVGVINYSLFLILLYTGISVNITIPIAYSIAASINYFLCLTLLFKHKSRWNFAVESILSVFMFITLGVLDFRITNILLTSGVYPGISKLISTILVFVIYFVGFKFMVFSEPPPGPWKPSLDNEMDR